MSLQPGKHYSICSGTGQQASVMNLVNSVTPSRILRTHGRWEPPWRVSSFVAVPTDELLQTAQQYPPGKARRFVRRRARQKAVKTSRSATKGFQSIEQDLLPRHNEKDSEQELAWLVSLVSETSQLYNGILGCVVVKHAEWGDASADVCGILPDSCLRLKAGDLFTVIEHLAVAPSLQRSGIGTALVQHVAATAAADGALLVYTYTTDDYTGANKFWSGVKWQEKSSVLLRKNTRNGYNFRGLPDSQTVYEYILLV